jgi:hypothetical protein
MLVRIDASLDKGMADVVAIFPKIKLGKTEALQFDRILADVP